MSNLVTKCVHTIYLKVLIMTKKVKVVWNKYWRLLVIEEIEKRIYKSWNMRMFICLCDCWNKHIASRSNLRSWEVKSCWCYNIEKIIQRNTTHSMSYDKLYWVWTSMKRRCNNKNGKNYYRYWWRGITYDPKRETFEWFYEDMWGSYKEWLSIDRIDNDWNYCKENCRRATQKQQCNNTRRNIKYKWKSIAQWCEITWVKQRVASSRIKSWKNKEEALWLVKFNHRWIKYYYLWTTLKKYCILNNISYDAVQHQIKYNWLSIEEAIICTKTK